MDIEEKKERVRIYIDYYIKLVSNNENAAAMEKLENLLIGIRKNLETDKIINIMMFIDYLMTTHKKFNYPYELLWQAYVILQSLI